MCITTFAHCACKSILTAGWVHTRCVVVLRADTSANLSRYASILMSINSSRQPGMLIVLLSLVWIFQERSSTFAFSPSARHAVTRLISDHHRHRRHGQSLLPPLSMCICIDCARVTNCAAYHFVETKHEQPHMTKDPTFTPRDGSPTIHVNVRTVRKEQDDDVVARMWKDYKAEEKQAELDAASAAATNQQKNDEQPQQQPAQLHGKTVYDLSSVTTYEYDVVACADFVKDKGCWIRNMPEEIRAANPDFVPT